MFYTRVFFPHFSSPFFFVPSTLFLQRFFFNAFSSTLHIDLYLNNQWPDFDKIWENALARDSLECISLPRSKVKGQGRTAILNFSVWGLSPQFLYILTNFVKTLNLTSTWVNHWRISFSRSKVKDQGHLSSLHFRFDGPVSS